MSSAFVVLERILFFPSEARATVFQHTSTPPQGDVLEAMLNRSQSARAVPAFFWPICRSKKASISVYRRSLFSSL